MSEIPEYLARELGYVASNMRSMANRLLMLRGLIDRTMSEILYKALPETLTPRERERIRAARDLLRFSEIRILREVGEALKSLDEAVELIKAIPRGEDHRSLVRARLRTIEAAFRLSMARKTLEETKYIYMKVFPTTATVIDNIAKDIRAIEERLTIDMADRLRKLATELRL